MIRPLLVNKTPPDMAIAAVTGEDEEALVTPLEAKEEVVVVVVNNNIQT